MLGDGIYLYDGCLDTYYLEGMEGIADNFFIPPVRRKISMYNFNKQAINRLRRTLNTKDMDIIHRWFRYNKDWDNVRPKDPELRAVAEKIRACQPFKLPKYIYRGVARGNSYDWGLVRNGWIYNDIDPNKENKPFDIKLERPMSFAMNIEKAKQFGSHGLFRYGVCLIILDTKQLKVTDYLTLTKEVLYLLDEYDKSDQSAVSNQKRKDKQKEMEENDVYYDDDEIVVFPTGKPLTIVARKPKDVHIDVK